MFIKQIKINGFRCYDAIDLVFKHRINVFFGDNGVGKTSILEAIYWLSTGKSFRCKNNKSLINQNHKAFVLYTAFNESLGMSSQSLGISYQKNKKKQIKLNYKPLNSHSQIAHQIPVVSIDPDSYLFIDKPPQFRRSFLDWLVFHVKPNYLTTWTQTMRCQKQLNVLYKAKKSKELSEWENQYVKFGEQLNQERQQVFKQLKTQVLHKVKKFIPELVDFQMDFYQGWLNGISLADLVYQDRDKNLMYGNMYAGIHKMDIKCKSNSLMAQEVLSRGQKKLLSIIFYLCFIEMIAEHTNHIPIICLDDLDAELDNNKTNLLCDFINQANNQIFISTVDTKKIAVMFEDVGMFHVKQNQQIITLP